MSNENRPDTEQDVAAQTEHLADAIDALQVREKQVHALSALVWRLCATLRAGHPTRMKATQYLREQNLMDKPLRQDDVTVEEKPEDDPNDFAPQAVVNIRLKGTEVQMLVQYDSDVFTVNPANPTGEPQPDMTNPAVFFARYLEIHHEQLIGLSQGEFALHHRVLMLTAAKVAESALAGRLLDADGNKMGGGTLQ